MSSKEYDDLVTRIFGTEERMKWLEENGVLPLEERVNRFESNDGPIGQRLAALENGTSNNAPTTFDIIGGTLTGKPKGD